MVAFDRLLELGLIIHNRRLAIKALIINDIVDVVAKLITRLPFSYDAFSINDSCPSCFHYTTSRRFVKRFLRCYRPISPHPIRPIFQPVAVAVGFQCLVLLRHLPADFLCALGIACGFEHIGFRFGFAHPALKLPLLADLVVKFLILVNALIARRPCRAIKALTLRRPAASVSSYSTEDFRNSLSETPRRTWCLMYSSRTAYG